ncbi:MAG: hypothetical protein ACYCZY_07125, partial [Lacisediminihabitans sp.]
DKRNCDKRNPLLPVLQSDAQLRTGGPDAIDVRFFDYGGIGCLWGVPNSDGIAIYGYSPISAADAATVQAYLGTHHFLRSEVGAATLFTLEPAADVFGTQDTYWFRVGQMAPRPWPCRARRDTG